MTFNRRQQRLVGEWRAGSAVCGTLEDVAAGVEAGSAASASTPRRLPRLELVDPESVLAAGLAEAESKRGAACGVTNADDVAVGGGDSSPDCADDDFDAAAAVVAAASVDERIAEAFAAVAVPTACGASCGAQPLLPPEADALAAMLNAVGESGGASGPPGIAAARWLHSGRASDAYSYRTVTADCTHRVLILSRGRETRTPEPAVHPHTRTPTAATLRYGRRGHRSRGPAAAGAARGARGRGGRAQLQVEVDAAARQWGGRSVGFKFERSSGGRQRHWHLWARLHRHRWQRRGGHFATFGAPRARVVGHRWRRRRRQCARRRAVITRVSDVDAT